MRLKRFKKVIAVTFAFLMLFSLGITASAEGVDFAPMQEVDWDPLPPPPEAVLSYSAHVQNIGWMDSVQAPTRAGTTGRGLRMEALEIDVRGLPEGSSFSGRWHVQNVGWQGANADGTGFRDAVDGILDVGTTGQSLRLEAVQFSAYIEGYTLWYRVHVANIGWMNWVSSGQIAGTTGRSLGIEAIEFQLRPDSADGGWYDGGYWYPGYNLGPQPNYNAEATVRAHVAGYGWLPYVSQFEQGTDGFAGTTGRSLQMEAIRIYESNTSLIGHVEYRVHSQNIGWGGYMRDGQVAGTTGQGLRMEAIQIRLTGELAAAYNVYYRVHVATIGWMDWVRNDAVAGTTGRGLAIEAIQVEFRPK